MCRCRQHEQYGYCQAGTSGLLTEDDSAVIGMPGPYTWRGTVFSVNISDDFLDRDKTQYFGPVTASTSPVDKYSYLGKATEAYADVAGALCGDKLELN